MEGALDSVEGGGGGFRVHAVCCEARDDVAEGGLYGVVIIEWRQRQRCARAAGAVEGRSAWGVEIAVGFAAKRW